MKIGIISDIHGNAVALDRVLERLEGCDEIVCAGDIVGYYPYFNQVIETLRKERIHSVLGNHDYSALTGDLRELDTYGKVSVTITMKNLEKKNREWLDNLPLMIQTPYFNIYHAFPSDSIDALMNFIYPSFPLIEKILEEEGKNIVVGHTHIQFKKDFNNLTLLNPGSVGQPRDGDSRAPFAIFDTEKKEFKFDRVEYNIYEVIMEVERAGLPTALGLRLLEGR
jgi:predicted phosphodiesterase